MQRGQIRTKEEEKILQGATLEEQEWFFVNREHEKRQAYAKAVAKIVMGKLQSRFNRERLSTVMDLAQDTRYLEGVMRAFQVSHDHVDYAVELVTRCFKKRFEVTGAN